MKLVTIVATVALLLFIVSCDAYNWPPYENRLRSMYSESKSVLIEIEAEMIADGLEYVGPGPQRSRHGQPELTEAQVEKYKNLFERLPFHWNLLHNNGETFISIDGPSPRGLGKDFYYALVHQDMPSDLLSCDTGGWAVSCGICAVNLGDNWSIQFSWHPRDIGPEWDGSVGEGLPTPEDIREQHRQELQECMDAGLKEMKFNLGGE